jgi:aminoglycoside phosphotransferase (APT) family kinase protein
MSNATKSVDLDVLTPYLEENIAEFQGPVTAKKFSGGQSNPTFLLTAQSGQYVLRRQPPGKLLKSAHAVDREYRVINALGDTDVPVAKAYHLCEDTSIIGSMFYVMSFIEGKTYWDPALSEFQKEDRSAYFDELMRILAAIHNVDVDAVGLGDYGKPGNYYERQIGRWTKQYRGAETDRIESMEKLIEWLPQNSPEDDGQRCLVHGDYRLDNVMFADGEAKGLAVLDWELSTLGHPIADLAYICMCMRLPRDAHIPGLVGIDRKEQGIPEESELLALYSKYRGIGEIENWGFYLAFCFFRLASIVQGVYKRAIEGNASSEDAVKAGKIARTLADMACEIIEQ